MVELEESRQTQKEFAAARGVSVSTLQFWVYKLRREARRAAAPQLLAVEVVSSTALAARQGAAAAVRGPSAAPLEAALPSGVVLRFSPGTDVDYLRAVLAALS